MPTDSTATSTPAAAPRPGWREVMRGVRDPKVALLLVLGLAAGLPFMLVGNTLGFWLRTEGIELGAIGFLSWVGIAYSVKFLWAPVVDRTTVPLLGRLGRRRGWLLLAQGGVVLGLLAMAILTPKGHLQLFGAIALGVALASATQDIVIDAWRIECAESSDQLAILSAAYQLGYRTALLLTDALIFLVAAQVGWASSYAAFAAMAFAGLVVVLFVGEPRSMGPSTVGLPPLWTPRGLYDAILGPFIAFFRQHRQMALAVLAAISLYRLADFVMGPMANPLYADLGIAEETIGTVRGGIGLAATFLGTAAAGVAALRLGLFPTLLLGAVLGPLSNLAFAWLALSGADNVVFGIAMAIDNFSAGFAGIALIAYMSSLTNVGYTATQYALLSSFYALLGKVMKGFSGVIVETLAQTRPLMEAYALFFAGTAALALPAIALVAWLARHAPAGVSSKS
ncbi:AmpG family muropeptide MFS transporter [Silanimonas sp.]|jgi:PAT family beta-lactamase induction signal transducer AmpG|uniref:AmpG family muropeptide MFS transporter n=1 Tax=Silanimonas sp. TaxID=1929290 RepID=UPI0022C9764D|nr:MFS transporter [Silanimonas sp.]MCZ8064259.1 MFS transporter [Silanimonas sp.]